MPHVSRCHARFAAGLLIAELVAGLSLRVLFPKPGARIVASETDGFLMEIFVDGMDRTRRDCGAQCRQPATYVSFGCAHLGVGLYTPSSPHV